MKKLAMMPAVCAILFFAAALFFANSAHAIQFDVLAPGYSQEIYAAPLTPNQEAGMAWTSTNNLLTRAGSTIFEYNPTQNAVVNGTNVHGVLATHPIAGLNSSGYGITNGKDGFVYAATGSGLQRFNPANWALPAQSLAGTFGGNGWGITTLSDGPIVYSDGGGTSNSVYSIGTRSLSRSRGRWRCSPAAWDYLSLGVGLVDDDDAVLQMIVSSLGTGTTG